MNAFLGGIWFIFVVLCPILTLAVLVTLASICRNWVQRTVFGCVGIGLLTLVLGPTGTTIGFVPWWFVAVGALPLANTEPWVWPYSLACVLLYTAMSFIAWLLRRSLGRR